MAEFNLKENILTTTIGDMISAFSAADLEEKIPFMMEDLNADVKRSVDEYQKLLSDGKYNEAVDYRNAHEELETLIFDAYKANKLMEKVAYLYLYAKAQIQQVVLDKEIPETLTLNEEQDIFSGQESGDVWLRQNQEDEYDDVNELNIRDSVGSYKTTAISPVLAYNNDIDDVKNIVLGNTTNVSNPKLSVTVDDLRYFSRNSMNEIVDNFNSKFIPNYYEPFKQSIVDAYKIVYPLEEVPQEISDSLGSLKNPNEEKDLYSSFVRNNFFCKRSSLNYKEFIVLLNPLLNENEYITGTNLTFVPELPSDFGEGALLLYAIITADRTIEYKEYDTYEMNTFYADGAYNYTNSLGTYDPIIVRDYVCKAKLSKSESKNKVLVNGGNPHFIANNSDEKFIIEFKNNQNVHTGINTMRPQTTFTSSTTTYYIKNKIKFVMIY